MPRYCEICRQVLEIGDRLRGLLRRKPAVCEFDTITGERRRIEARWLCEECRHRYCPKGKG